MYLNTHSHQVLKEDLTDVGHVLLFDHRYDSPDIKFHNAMQEHHKLGAPDLRSTVEEVHLVLTYLAQVHDLMKL